MSKCHRMMFVCMCVRVFVCVCACMCASVYTVLRVQGVGGGCV